MGIASELMQIDLIPLAGQAATRSPLIA